MPNGTLFGDGVCARIKEELLKEFNLHTIVRLPNGVFAPYTEHPDEPAVLRPLRPDAGRLVLRAAAARRAGRTTPRPQPIQFEEFADCLAWWSEARGERAGLESARRRAAGQRLQPRPQEPAAPRRTSSTCRPSNWPTTSSQKEQRIAEIMQHIQELLGREAAERTSLPPSQPDNARHVEELHEILASSRRTSARAVNALMTATYWEIGRRIVEFEQAAAGERATASDRPKLR